MTPNQVKGIMV